MALISCRDAAFSYEGNTVVRGLNFEVADGDYLCIVGENGSGKSTLIKGLLRQKRPVAGSVSIDKGLRQSDLGYLPQQTAAQKDFPAGVYEVVLSGRLNRRGLRPFYSREDRAAAKEYMRRLDITSLQNRCYRELSGGQQQRVLLARALCATRRVLLLDEPVAGLDPMATHDLYSQIGKLKKETGITVVMVSHDVHCAVTHASHILHLKNRQVYFGTAAGYAQSAAGASFLGGHADV